MKKIIALVLLMCFSLSSISAFAVGNDTQDLEKGILKKEILLDLNKANEAKRYRNIEVPSKEEIKRVLKDFFNKNKTGNEKNIENIDIIASEFVTYIKDLKQFDVSTQDWRWYPH